MQKERLPENETDELEEYNTKEVFMLVRLANMEMNQSYAAEAILSEM